MPPEDDETTGTEDSQVPDSSAYEAKIAELMAANAERDAAIASLTSDLTAAKAANYDLLMSIPKGDTSSDTDEINEIDDDIDVDDLFE